MWNIPGVHFIGNSSWRYYNIKNMKHLKEHLVNEANSRCWKPGIMGTEMSTKADILAVGISDSNRKKFGFLSYDPDTDTCFLETFDSVEDLAHLYGTDNTEGRAGIEKTKIGEVWYGERGDFALRIW